MFNDYYCIVCFVVIGFQANAMSETMVSLMPQVLSCYGACFGHALRQPIMKELQQALENCIDIKSGLLWSEVLVNLIRTSNRMLRSTKTFQLEGHYESSPSIMLGVRYTTSSIVGMVDLAMLHMAEPHSLSLQSSI